MDARCSVFGKVWETGSKGSYFIWSLDMMIGESEGCTKASVLLMAHHINVSYVEDNSLIYLNFKLYWILLYFLFSLFNIFISLCFMYYMII